MVNEQELRRESINTYIVGLIIMLISNLCFYTSTSVLLYIILSSIGIVIIWTKHLISYKFIIRIGKAVTWLTVIFIMFTCYGTLYLQKGTYNWDKMLFMYIQSLTFYICLSEILKSKDWLTCLFRSFSISVIVTIVYLTIMEGNNILLGTMRIGNSISGDVSVVADSLAIMLLLIFYYSLDRKSRFAGLLTLIILAFMLLTGSKRVAFALLIMLYLAWPYAKKKINILLAICVVVAFVIYLIFESQYFYNLIGYRFFDMFMQLTGRGSTAYYTSTNARMGMIKEAFSIFLKKPLFGGGVGYYSSQSKTWGYYNYSHCNYTELLCTYGIFGTIIYYFPYVDNIRKLKRRESSKNGERLVIGMLLLILLIDWAAVSYLSICVYYIPIVFSFAFLDTEIVRMDSV